MIRVFVGCSSGEDTESQAVLEYSLRQRCSQPVEITWMALSRDPASPWGGWNTAGWSTPFTALRWAIPAVCGFEGRAIYLDSDMIVRGDLAELWRQPMPHGAFALAKGAGRKLRTCVMLLDCAAAQGVLPPLAELKVMEGQHARILALIAAEPRRVGRFQGLWNCVDLKEGVGIDDPAVKIVHYSSVAHQPHLRHAVARLARRGRTHWYDGERFDHWRPELTALFDQLLAEASAGGYPPERYEPAAPWRPGDLRSYSGKRVKGFSA